MLRLGTALLTGALLTALLTTAQTRTQTGIAEQPAGPVASGTARGEPSPRNASYSIDVELDTERRTLTGREVLTWRNISSIATDDLRFHLYYNAWKNTQSTWMRERLRGRGSSLHGRSESDWGWIDVTAIRLLGAGDERPIDLTDTVSYIAPDDGNPHDQTVLAVPLPRPVGPGETVNVEIEWISRVKREHLV